MVNSTVSIIIITRNRPALLQYCLEHVLAQPYPRKEIIVVDSSSNDESERVLAQYPDVISLRLHGQRNNMPQARNIGMALSSGEILAFVDDDAMVEQGWLDALIDTYRDETVGAVGGRIIEVPKPHCDLLTGAPIFSVRPSGRVIGRNRGTANTEQVEVDWLAGGNMSFRRKALEQVGGFDPGYTLTNGREDIDFSFRVKRAGWRIVFNPAMAVVHYSPRSSDLHFQNRPLTQFAHGRNNTYFTIKHFGLNLYPLTCQLFLAPVRMCGLTIYRAALLSLATLAQMVGRLVGLGAGIHWLLSSRRRAESAPKILQPDLSNVAQPSYTVLNERDTPTVSIIIITRNRPALLQYCLEHVLAQPYPRKEIIVVDSSSNDESERVLAQYPDVISLRLHGQRNNMPQARNIGMAIASGDIIAFVDDDAMVEQGWLDALMNTYQDETVGAAGGRIITMPEPHCEQVIGAPSLAIRPSGRAIIENLGSFSTDQVEVDWLSGCNMSFRRKALEQVGGFDPGYTLTNAREDMDLSFRVKRAGWHIVFNPAMAVTHYSPRSSDLYFQNRPLTQFSNGRNSAYFTIKHFGFNPYTLTCQLILAPARDCGLAVYRACLLSVAALAQSVGRVVGLGAGIRWLISSRQRAESAPKIWHSGQSITVQPPCLVLNKKE